MVFFINEIKKLDYFIKKAGVPDSVINIITRSRNKAEIFLNHLDIAGMYLVGSTYTYSTAATNRKRV